MKCNAWRDCAYEGMPAHTCLTCAGTFHHACAALAEHSLPSGWDTCHNCNAAQKRGGVLVPAVPSNNDVIAEAGGGAAAALVSAPGGQGARIRARLASPIASKGSTNPWTKAAGGKSLPATKAAAKGPSPAAGRAAAATGPEAVAALLATAEPIPHETARQRVVPLNDGGARKRSRGNTDVDDDESDDESEWGRDTCRNRAASGSAQTQDVYG
jgi:hypothetical protein